MGNPRAQFPILLVPICMSISLYSCVYNIYSANWLVSFDHPSWAKLLGKVPSLLLQNQPCVSSAILSSSTQTCSCGPWQPCIDLHPGVRYTIQCVEDAELVLEMEPSSSSFHLPHSISMYLAPTTCQTFYSLLGRDC